MTTHVQRYLELRRMGLSEVHAYERLVVETAEPVIFWNPEPVIPNNPLNPLQQ